MSAFGPLTLILMLGLLAIFVVALLLGVARARQGRAAHLRPIPGYEQAHRAIARAAESGQPLHLSPGPAAVGESGTGTAETLAGLTLVEALGRQAALTGAALLVTSDDAITHALNENGIRAGYAAAGRSDEAPLVGRIAARTLEGHGQGVRLLAQRDPLAYAAAAGDMVEHEGMMHSIASGGFGPEYLLLGEGLARGGVPAVAGATNPQALATMLVSAQQTLIGEEIYGAGAYLHRAAAHLASLQAQDLVRALLILLILAGAIAASTLGPGALAALLALTQ
jgi:hypothetical protein